MLPVTLLNGTTAAPEAWTAAQRSAWRLPLRMTVSEWADQHRVLDTFSSEPGRWRTDRVPYAREWMDSACCRWVRRVSIMASTQVGKTEALNNVIGYHVHQSPCPIMMVLPRADDAALAQRRRIDPMVRASEALRGELTSSKHDVKRREMTFKRCSVYFRSAQSPAELASIPVKLLLGDECDKWPVWTGREANPLDLVMERTRTFFDHIVYLGSTPKTRENLIHREYLEGDQRQFWLRCPKCSVDLLFIWPQVKWPKEIETGKAMRKAKRAWYECQHCGAEISDREKPAMLAAGLWVPDGKEPKEWREGGSAADRADHRSYHIWAAYSPWLSWWKIAAQWLYSRGHPEREQNFVNSWRAEVWEDTVDETSPDAAAACIDPARPQGDVPREVQVVTAAVDVQKGWLAWCAWGWGLDEESWLLAAGVCHTWEEVDAAIFHPWGPRNLQPRCCLVDSRHRRAEVIDYARKRRPVVRMIAGVERESPVPFGSLRIEKHPRTGESLPNSMRLWTIHVGIFKDLLAARIALSGDEKHEGNAGRVHLPSDLPDDVLAQLSSEHKVRVRSRGHERMRWVLKSGHRRNELWDLAVYNAAAGRLVRCDLLRSSKPLDGDQQSGEAPPTQPRPARPPRRRLPGSGGLFASIGGG